MGYEARKLSTFCEMPIGRVTVLAMTARLDSIEWYCRTRILLVNNEVLELFLAVSVNKKL
jgi:hypothetical protein